MESKVSMLSVNVPKIDPVLEYPPEVQVSGLPFLLQGWNTTFTRVEGELSEGCPIYHLDGYTLYYLFPILSATIKKVGGSWRFLRDCDEGIPLFIKDKNIGTGNIFGSWGAQNYNMRVTAIWD